MARRRAPVTARGRKAAAARRSAARKTVLSAAARKRIAATKKRRGLRKIEKSKAGCDLNREDLLDLARKNKVKRFSRLTKCELTRKLRNKGVQLSYF